MHRDTPLHAQIFKILFPFAPSDDNTDPNSWTEYVRKNLVPELRREVHMYYGDALAHTVEARFPGLDYALPIHRQRLRRFPNHRRLFDALDELGLTANEIHRLCDWEGTLWVKRRYEAGRGSIRETAGDFIFGGREDRAARAAKRAARVEVGGEDGDEDEEEDEEFEVAELVEHEEDEEAAATAELQARFIQGATALVQGAIPGHLDADAAITAEPAYSRHTQHQSPSAWPSTPSVNVPSTNLRMQMTSSGARPEAARAAA